jgi:cell division transport system permease protein
MSRRRKLGLEHQAGLRAWARRHGFSLLSSLGSVLRRPVDSLLTMLVLGLALSLPLALHLSVSNLSAVGEAWDSQDTVSVFLTPGLTETEALRINAAISLLPGVAAADPISPAEALDELGQQIDMLAVQALLDSQPLPWVVEVVPASTEVMEVLIAAISELTDVDQVVIDLDWLRRFQALLALAEGFARLLAVAFAVGVLVVIGHSIRMDIHNRREEIEVMDLVGATAGFIRRPFLYQGMWFGIAGGALAWGLVEMARWWLNAPVARLSASYGSEAHLVGLAPELGVTVMALSALTGIVAAWLMVGQHLRRLGQASVQGG